MGKRRRRRKPTPVRPDKEFSFAGTTIRQFGRLIEFHTQRTPKEQAKLEAHQAGMYGEVCEAINNSVRRIRSLVSSYDPLELLQHGYWALCVSMVGKETEADYGPEDAVHAAMVSYLQSLIVSSPPSATTQSLSEEQWTSLFAEVKGLYERLFVQFFIVNSAHLKATDPGYDLEYDAFCVQAQMQWAFVRGLRYPIHDLQFLSDFLGPHDEVFGGLFGISVQTFLDAIEAIHRSLCRDNISAFEELRAEHARFVQSLDAQGEQAGADADLVAGFSRLSQDKSVRQHMSSIAGKICGYDLFDLQRVTSLPTCLLDELSYAPGEDTDFFAPGQYAGWPFRVLPIKRRPFLKVAGRHYCFNFIDLMDDIYRVTQRMVCRLAPSYREKWNGRQKEASERRPIELLCELLPGATSFRSVHYEVGTSPGQSAQWCELDGLILYDDVMLIVEVKAGAFTWTPPSTDFPAYLESLKGLLRKPAEQAARFLDYLDSADSVPIYDAQHRNLATISASSYRLRVPLCVTLDALTTAAHQIAELKPVGITVPRPVCSLSIDDLRILRDVFDSPGAFAHFLLKRYEAERSPEVHVTDQLDHLGLYLEYLDYVHYAKQLSAGWKTDVRHWDGYRKPIDRYFFYLSAQAPAVEKPGLPIGKLLLDILGKLDVSGKAGRSRCASVLLDMIPETRKGFEKQVRPSLSRSRQRGQPSPFHVHGDSSITVFLEAPGVASWAAQNKIDYTFTWMLRSQHQERLLLTLSFSADEELTAVDWRFLRLDDLTESERRRIAAISDRQAGVRVARQLDIDGRIGRNDPCPCGSGKKYKRCCGRDKG